MTKRSAVSTTTSIGEWLPIGQVKRWDKNPRLNERAVEPVAKSIARFGFIAPIVIWTSRDRMVAGHTRLSAMESLLTHNPAFVPPGAPTVGVVPVRMHEFANEAEADAYALADNKLGELADWDPVKLADVLKALSEDNAAIVVDLGWSEKEIASFVHDEPLSSDNLPQMGAIEYRLIVRCKDESDQAVLLERLEGEGYTCQVLMS